MRKVNITLEVSDIRLTDLENFLDRNYGLIDFRILPDTKAIDNYINEKQ